MNWKKILADLAAANLTQVQIGAECGCGQSTISDLQSGKTTRPGFDLGQKIIALHTARVAAKASRRSRKSLTD